MPRLIITPLLISTILFADCYAQTAPKSRLIAYSRSNRSTGIAEDSFAITYHDIKGSHFNTRRQHYFPVCNELKGWQQELFFSDISNPYLDIPYTPGKLFLSWNDVAYDTMIYYRRAQTQEPFTPYAMQIKQYGGGAKDEMSYCELILLTDKLKLFPSRSTISYNAQGLPESIRLAYYDGTTWKTEEPQQLFYNAVGQLIKDSATTQVRLYHYTASGLLDTLTHYEHAHGNIRRSWRYTFEYDGKNLIAHKIEQHHPFVQTDSLYVAKLFRYQYQPGTDRIRAADNFEGATNGQISLSTHDYWLRDRTTHRLDTIVYPASTTTFYAKVFKYDSLDNPVTITIYSYYPYIRRQEYRFYYELIDTTNKNVLQPPAQYRFALFPNPSSGSFTFTTPAAGRLILYSLTGSTVANYTIIRGSQVLQLPSALITTYYYARFVANDGGLTQVFPLLYQP